MPQFVNAPKATRATKDKIVLGSTEDLLKWITGVIGRDWSVTVYENMGVEKTRAGRISRHTRFAVHVRLHNPYFVDVESAETLVGLAKRFQSELWPRMQQEDARREKGQAVKAQAMQPQNVIESRQPRLTHKPAALPAPRPLALTHKPAALPAAKPTRTLFEKDDA